MRDVYCVRVVVRCFCTHFVRVHLWANSGRHYKLYSKQTYGQLNVNLCRTECQTCCLFNIFIYTNIFFRFDSVVPRSIYVFLMAVAVAMSVAALAEAVKGVDEKVTESCTTSTFTLSNALFIRFELLFCNFCWQFRATKSIEPTEKSHATIIVYVLFFRSKFIGSTTLMSNEFFMFCRVCTFWYVQNTHRRRKWYYVRSILSLWFDGIFHTQKSERK